MKKRVLAMFLAAAVVCGLAACGNQGGQEKEGTPESTGQQGTQDDGQDASQEAEGQEAEGQDAESGSDTGSDYDTTIPFSLTNYFVNFKMSGGYDYESDPVWQYIEDRFNVDIELWTQEYDGHVEKCRTWIATETMPDAMMWCEWSIGSEYFTNAEQGLLKALPDGWETRWPELARMIQNTGVRDALEVDGKVYAIPHATSGLYSASDMQTSGSVMYFRKDWAEQVGMPDLGKDYKMTISELEDYMRKIREAGLTDKPMGNAMFWIDRVMECAYGLPQQEFQRFVPREDYYEFALDSEAFPERITMISDIRRWYQDGLLDSDFYVNDASYYLAAFGNGQIGTFPYSSSYGDLSSVWNAFQQGTAGLDPDEVVGLAVVCGDDGLLSATGSSNWWTAHMFNPDMDDATFERILDVFDFLCSKEGTIMSMTGGVQGVDWEFDQEGKIVYLNEAIKENDNSEQPFYFMGYGGFANLASVNPETDFDRLAIMDAILEIQRAADILYPVDPNYLTFTGESKANYSLDTRGAMTEIVCKEGDVDVAKEWADWLEENSAIWEPLLNDLTETYYGN